MKLPKQLFLLAAMFAFCCNYNAAYGNNPGYQQRVTTYIANGLTNFNENALVLQAYENLPLDTPTLNSVLNGITAGIVSDFNIVQMVRVLYFTHGQYDSVILASLNSVPYWINYGDTTRVFWSENHMSMWMSSDWLLHEKYGKVVDGNLRNRLVHYLHLKIQYGYYEFFSTVYNPYCLSGLLNLADFAQDPEIQSLATQAAQRLMIELLRPVNDQGVIYAVAGRNYDDKYENPYGQNHNNLIYLLTGLGQQPTNASHSAAFLASSTIAIDTVVATWTPVMDTQYVIGHTIQTGLMLNDSMGALDSIIFGWSAGEYFHPLLALSTFNLLTDSNMWHHPDFSAFVSLSSIPPSYVVPLAFGLNVASESSVICDDTLTIYKHNSVTLSSVQDFWPGKLGYQQYTCVANIDTTAVYPLSGQVLPWGSRNPDEANDDLPYVKQIKNVALLMYRPQPKQSIIGASYPQVSLHWTDSCFTQIIDDTSNLWLLGRINNNYVAVRRSCTGYINGFRGCDIPNGQAWVIMVGDSATYGSFSNFQSVVDSSQFTEQWYYDTAAQQEVFYAQIIVDSINISHAWGVDSTMPTGIIDITGAQAFNVFPNPASDVVNVQFSGNAPQNGKLEIYNTAGQLVYQTEVTGTLMAIPTGNLPAGVYAMRLATGMSCGGTRCFVVGY